MPLINSTAPSRNTILYASWKPIASNNKVRYFEFDAPTKYLAAFGKLGTVLLTMIEDADVTDFDSVFKPTASAVLTENEVSELCSLDSMIGALDGRQQKAYDFQDTVLYFGYADFGVLTSESTWTIKKLDLDTNGNPLAEQWTAVESAVWDDRLTETYL